VFIDMLNLNWGNPLIMVKSCNRERICQWRVRPAIMGESSTLKITGSS
jgi:hypothetical protein